MTKTDVLVEGKGGPSGHAQHVSHTSSEPRRHTLSSVTYAADSYLGEKLPLHEKGLTLRRKHCTAPVTPDLN